MECRGARRRTRTGEINNNNTSSRARRAAPRRGYRAVPYRTLLNVGTERCCGDGISWIRGIRVVGFAFWYVGWCGDKPLGLIGGYLIYHRPYASGTLAPTPCASFLCILPTYLVDRAGGIYIVRSDLALSAFTAECLKASLKCIVLTCN